MARKIANGLQLTKQCWNALRQNPQLMMFPLISGLTLMLVTVAFAIPTALGGWWLSGGQLPTSTEEITTAEWVFGVVMTFLFYFAAYTVIIFSNTALVGASLKLLKGEPATVGDGLAIALGRLGPIFGFALISATIGTLAQMGRNAGRDSDNNAIVRIVAVVVSSLVQGVWSVVVFFAIPVYVVENVGPIQAIRRSWEIFKRTWGEGFTGRAAIAGVSGLVQILLVLLVVALVVGSIALGSLPLIILAILFGVVVFSAVALITGAVNGVFQASLYQYATTGHAGRFIDNDLARNAFPT